MNIRQKKKFKKKLCYKKYSNVRYAIIKHNMNVYAEANFTKEDEPLIGNVLMSKNGKHVLKVTFYTKCTPVSMGYKGGEI